ncbi:MAG: hypothetical protein EOP85_06215 [Verrucomicrobiaceae bacterium]|nr:MAG: hypothetical protein EOP85_06215 [Verrucomicrobiaceae bacterium]
MFSRFSNCLGILATSTACLHGGETAASIMTGPEPVPILSVDVGMTVADQYMTRGFVVQDEGISYQPHLDLEANFHQGDGFIHSASVLVGLWSVISSSPYGDGGNRFTEFDYGTGVTVGFARRWTFTTFYNRWTSPAGAYGDGHWLNGTIEYDDQGLLHGNFSFNPFIQITHDLETASASGLCIEPGFRPTHIFFQDSEMPFTGALLVMAGLGSGYYGDDYGYLAIGPQVSLPLTFMDASAGDWTLSADCLYYDYGRSVTAYNKKSRDLFFSISLNIGF